MQDYAPVRLTSPANPDRNWLDWFREEFARHFTRLDIEIESNSPFRYDGVVRALPGIAVWQGYSVPAMRVIHDPKQSEGDDLVLTIAPDAPMSIQIKGVDVLVEPWGGFLVANDVPDVATHGASSNQVSVRLSRKLLAPLVPGLADVVGTSIPADSQPLRLLRNYIKLMDGEELLASPEAGHLVTTHIRDLVALAIRSTRDVAAEAQTGARAARLAAVKSDIIANITSRQVTIDKVAKRHGVSPRYIGSLFASCGTTFTDFVLQERLAHAQRVLTDPRFAHHAISTIAYDSGFGDLSYFNHSFRRHYNATPSEIRMAARTAANDVQAEKKRSA